MQLRVQNDRGGFRVMSVCNCIPNGTETGMGGFSARPGLTTEDNDAVMALQASGSGSGRV